MILTGYVVAGLELLHVLAGDVDSSVSLNFGSVFVPLFLLVLDLTQEPFWLQCSYDLQD